jgi:hypothetical protein
VVKKQSIVLALAAAVALLSGCTAGSPIGLTDTPATPIVGAGSPSAAPVAPASATPTEAPVITDGPCTGAAIQLPAQPDDVEQLGGMTLLTPIDTGTRPYASGAARPNSAGAPVAYVVAENDNFDSIAARFCVGPIWLYWVNAARREGNGQTLFEGDTLNLDAHTIYSVGDQNGTVHDNDLPENFKIPPQS